MLISEFQQTIRQFALELQYEVSERGPKHLAIQHSNSLIVFHILFEKNGVVTYIYYRTTSWDAEGERTDLNDFLSVLLAVFFRLLRTGISCTLYDIANPAFDGDECEVYARFIAFGQPEGRLSLSIDSIERLKNFLVIISLYERSLPLLLTWDANVPPAYSFMNDDLDSWRVRVQGALDLPFSDTEWACNLRSNPHWFYFRSVTASVSVINSPQTAYALRQFMQPEAKWHGMPGPSVRFFKSEVAHNAVLNEDITRSIKFFERLEGNSAEPVFVPIENRLVVIGSEHIGIFTKDCDRRVYNSGIDELVQRRRAENEALFDGQIYSWAERIDGARFEQFTRDLLSRRSGVVRVRQTSLTNEGMQMLTSCAHGTYRRSRLSNSLKKH